MMMRFVYSNPNRTKIYSSDREVLAIKICHASKQHSNALMIQDGNTGKKIRQDIFEGDFLFASWTNRITPNNTMWSAT